MGNREPLYRVTCNRCGKPYWTTATRRIDSQLCLDCRVADREANTQPVIVRETWTEGNGGMQVFERQSLRGARLQELSFKAKSNATLEEMKELQMLLGTV